jgi:hypothetical protein
VETVEGDMFAQYGCLNFHAKRDGGSKLRLTVKNKWSSGWTKSWFYLRNFIGRTSVYALHSRMSMLDYTVESEVECLDSNANNTGFIRATATIRGRDAVEEFLACKMYPLAAGYGFKGVTIGTMLVLKVRTPLPLFPVEAVSTEDVVHVLVELEMEVERILGSFRLREYDALQTTKLPNGGRLNHIF